jgi:hypothetical protein
MPKKTELSENAFHSLIARFFKRVFIRIALNLGLAEKLKNTRKSKQNKEKRSLRVFFNKAKTRVFTFSH